MVSDVKTVLHRKFGRARAAVAPLAIVPSPGQRREASEILFSKAPRCGEQHAAVVQKSNGGHPLFPPAGSSPQPEASSSDARLKKLQGARDWERGTAGG
ncbi:hypothetical protein DNTS_035639 [Danionella cerebrum]|uniref:Uncharacterized protein n=1 Tax=Danionella cerebrum TaxID=2873325 RepID=A0A553R9G2_9TELE|nr:hypothetical protein DNTS_035639 [Danionella translucida]